MKILKRLQSRSGMTLLEMMFAVLITVMICGAIWGVSNFVERLRAQDEIRMEITDEARGAMEKILWGYRPAGDSNAQRDGVREARSYQILDGGTRLTFTDTTGAVRQVRLTGTNIEYMEPGMATWARLYAPPAGEPAQTTLLFSNSNASADVVVVELVIGRRVQDRWFYASLQSKVLVRN